MKLRFKLYEEPGNIIEIMSVVLFVFLDLALLAAIVLRALS